MAMHDCRDVPLSTSNGAALAAYERAVELFHGYFGNPLGEIEQALAADPGFVMGHCLRAALCMSTTEKAAEPALRESVEAAEALAAGANERERGHIAAARAWLDGDFERTAKLYGDVLFDYPRDSLALQMGHLCDFFLGHTAMLRDRVARALPAWDERVPGYGYVLGMHAFGLEENGDYARAEASGRRAVALQPRDPWATHAVTHVMEMQGRVAEGIDWLRTTSPHWSADNAFAYHNWWHLALFHLDRGELDRVLVLYDGAIRPARSKVQLEMIDASGLLWRLYLRGAEVGVRWQELADDWEAFTGDAYYVFNDVHAMLAFVAAGRETAADALLQALWRRSGEGGSNGMMTREVGLPLCRALVAFGRGQYAAALDGLLAVRPFAQRFGGSHAQRDLIALTALEAALRGGNAGAARALAAERLDLKPESRSNRDLLRRAAAIPAGGPVPAGVLLGA